MQEKSSPKEEKFARLLLEGKSQSEAYRLVYPHSKRWKPKSVHEKASKLAVKVRPRVNSMREEAKERSLLTLEDHMRQLEELRNGAKGDATWSAAIAAEVKRGELMGFYVARTESVNTNFVISGSPEEHADVDPDEWAEQNRPN